MPSVSIIILTYNRVRYLNECLDSVFNQTYKDFEVIVVDDGSTEDVEGLINKNYPGKVRYLKHRENLGRGTMFPGIFTGLKVAAGEYILLLGDDDMLEREHMSIALEIFRDNPAIGCFSCDMTHIDSDGNIRLKESHFASYLKKREPGLKLVDKVLSIEDVFMYALGTASSGAIFKKEMIDEIGFYREECGIAADWEYAFRITAASRFKLYFCSRALVKYRSHPSNISKNHYEGNRLILKVLVETLHKYPQLKRNLGYRKIKKRMTQLIKEFAFSSFKAHKYIEFMGIIMKLIIRVHFMFLCGR